MSGTVGSIGVGGSASQPDFEFEILCDTNLGVVTKFLRRYKTDSAGATTVVNTRLDGTTAYNPVGTVDVCKDACESVVVLCDNTGEFLRHYGCDGTTRDTALDGTTAHVVAGTPKICRALQVFAHVLCDDGVSFLRRFTVAEDGTVSSVDTELDGLTAYAPVGTVSDCETLLESTSECFTVTTAGTGISVGDRVIRLTVWDVSTNPPTLFSTVYLNRTTGLVLATPPNAVDLQSCDGPGFQYVQLCDNNGAFLRRIIRNSDGSYSVADFTLDGSTVYVVSGPVVVCEQKPVQIVDLCDDTDGDSIADTQYRAIVQIGTNGVTTVLAYYENDLLTAYVPVSPVECSVPTISEEVLCDDNGPFLRYYIRNTLGVVTTKDMLLDGSATYTTVGAVNICNPSTKPCATCRS